MFAVLVFEALAASDVLLRGSFITAEMTAKVESLPRRPAEEFLSEPDVRKAVWAGLALPDSSNPAALSWFVAGCGLALLL